MKRPVVYADNAATTRLDGVAYEAMQPFLLEEYGNASSAYSFSRTPKAALREAREKVACAINASPKEIFFTSGGTEANNWAIRGIYGYLKRHFKLIISSIEHPSVMNVSASLARDGVTVNSLPVDDHGVILPKVLRESIGSDVLLVSVMHANNEIGTIQPIQTLAQIAHEQGSLFHTDAVQTVGHIPLDVKELGVDLLTASAHKFNGPKGVGFIYVRDGAQLLPFLLGGAQESRMRAGTENVAGIVGMAVALINNLEHIGSNSAHLRQLENALIIGLAERGIDYILNGGDKRLPGIISLSFRNQNGEAILHRLDLDGICVSTGSACNSMSTEPSHVIKALRLKEEYGIGTIRVSFGKHNSLDDIDRILDALGKICRAKRSK